MLERKVKAWTLKEDGVRGEGLRKTRMNRS